MFGLFIDSHDAYYMVMEYIEKGCLKELLLAEKTMKKQEIYDIIISICKGMVYLESKGIMHRDLAARNILVSQINGKYSCVVADFGLSRETSEYKSEGSVIPVRWAAPEVIMHQTITSKADVWSYAVVIHEVNIVSVQNVI